MKTKRFVSLTVVVAICMSLFANFTITAQAEGESDVYTADFTSLVKDNADTTYGSAEDIYDVGDYIKAYLTYSGTQVKADGTIYLTTGTTGNADGAYAKGSYISFTAPQNGKLVVVGNKLARWDGNKYSGSYSTKDITFTINAAAGDVYNFGCRTSGATITSITFTPDNTPDITATPAPYTSPQTVWTFDDHLPAENGANVPVISGQTEYDSENGEIKFPAGLTGTGTVTLDLEPSIAGDTEIEFDTTGHSQTLGQQYLYFTVTNSEGEEILSLSAHPYDSTGDYAGKNKLVIGGETIAENEDVRKLFSENGTTHVKLTIDYTARKVKAVLGSTTFNGTILAKTMKDVAQFKFWVSRSKTADARYISFDNLSVKKFTSTETPATDESLAAYTPATYGGVASRVKAPTAATGKPIVIFLSSSSRFGTDNEGQLYQAEDFFNLFGDNDAILAAPQAENAWDATSLKAYIDGIKAAYNATDVTVIGNLEGAAAAYALAKENAVNKIIPISGYDSAITATTAKVWAFGGYNDENLTAIRTTINTLQKAGADVLYTELPFDGSGIIDKAAAAEGMKDWILSNAASPKTVDLVIFMGQSNMAGRGEYADATPVAAGHGYEYHPVTEPGVITTISEPFGKYENNTAVNDNGSDGADRRGGGMVSAFMESYYEVSGVPIVGVQCNRGGTESKWWYQTTDTTNNLTPRDEAVARYNEAKKYLTDSGYTIGKQFMVWCQGEQDASANRGTAAWKTNTLKLFNDMKDTLGLTDLMIVRIGHCKTTGAAAIDAAVDPRYKAINLAGKELAEDNENITAVASLYTNEYAELMRDQYHYHQAAYNSVGAVAGNNAAVTLYSSGTWTDYPEPDDETDEPVVVDGIFEKTTNMAEIDISDMKNYGADTFRVYKPDKSFVDVKAEGGKVTNPTSGEVTVVPIYRFNYTNAAMDGYTTATGTFTAEAGYGLIDGQSYSTNSNGSLPTGSATLKVVLPAGSYDMNILRKGGTRTDVYNDGIQIINNTTAAESGNNHRGSAYGLMYAPQILISDGSADITIGNTSGANERIASMEIVKVPDKYKKPVIWVAGDSESANYYPIDADGDDLGSKELKITGFGTQLPKFLSDKYKVANWGQPSATVKTWYNECFDAVNYRMAEGDAIIIDFGINDSVSSTNAINRTEMMEYMTTIFSAAKAKGATPILVSPLWNSKFQHRTYFTYSKDTDANEMYAFAEIAGVSYIDLNKWSQLYKDKAIEETGDSDWVKHNYHVSDNLHQTQHSSLLLASFIAAGMKSLGFETTDFAYTYTDIAELTDDYVRKTDSENKRVYSVAAAEAFMKNGLITKPSEGGGEEPTPSEPSGTIAVDDDKTVTVTITNTDKAVLIRTRHENGALTKMDVYDNLTFNEGTAAKQISDLKNGDELYLWNSVSGMKPLCEKKTVAELTEEPEEPEEPSTTLYSENFESYTAGVKSSNQKLNSWVTPAGILEVKSDSTDGIGQYMTVVSGNSGTCRSGYVELTNAVTQNFVFECDYKSTSYANVSDLELLENKGSVYNNHGVNSNSNFVFTMARPKSSNVYVINNKTDDSGLTEGRYTDPVFKTAEITGNPWLHVKVVGNFDTQTVIVYITSLDGKTEYHRGVYDMNVGRDKEITSWKCIHLLSPSTGADTCIDNIIVRTATKKDLAPSYHSVKITVGKTSFDQYVLDGETVVNIPSTDIYGESFEGWKVGNGDTLLTSAQLAAYAVKNDCIITGQINESYIEALSEVSFKDFPAGNEIAMGTDENTYGDNIISLNIVGEQGTSLVTNPDSRVSDYKVEWKFDGFRTLDGRATGETGSSYCEGYGLVEITEAAQSSVSFKMKKTSGNYYGRVTAKVTYNGKTEEISQPLVILGDKSNTTIIPKAGYTADYNKYEAGLVGYRALSGDILTGGWSTAGSDGTYIYLQSDSTGKYLSLSRAASNNSSVVYNEIGNITGQTVFEQDIRFGMDGSVKYVGGSTTSPTSTAFIVAKSGSNVTFNGATIYNAATSTDWYHIVVTADPTSKLTHAEVYNMSGTLLGKSETVAFQTYASGAYYEINLSTKDKTKTIDINNIKIYEAEIDVGSITISGDETAQIPENGTATVNFTATAKTSDGDDAIGAVTWTIDDELATGVAIASDGTLTITPDASSGNLPIKATIGGKSKTKTIKLTGTRSNVAFTEAPLGIQLGNAGEYQYTAELRDGNANKIDGTVTYSLANSDGSAAAYTGVSIDAASGKLSVAENAEPQTIYVKATSVEYSKLAKTTIYALKFSFGTNTAASGYTQVISSNSYSEAKGFGIEGTAADEASDITGNGAAFKLKLEKGKVYSVKAKYQGAIRMERIDSTFTGFERKLDTLGEDTFSVAVFGDDILDINLTSGAKLASVEITPVSKSAAPKPDWWTIGDSTVQQNGSWGYTIAAASTTDLSKYPELATVINGFHNSGKAGEQHKNFYTNGRLNTILTQMNKGDVVSLSNMGTNDSSSTREQFYAYDKMYIDAILDMGGYVILGSYTPTGNYGPTQGKVYDADTMTFKGMRTNSYDLAIRELYEAYKDNDHVLGFLDTGKMADEKMTADVKAVYDATDGDETAKRAAANARAEEMMAWWKDYNHYYISFSNYILPDITKAVAALIK